MNIKMHLFLDDRKVMDWRVGYVPRVGDTVRIAEGCYAKVTEVIWCYDEQHERVNVRTESIEVVK